MYLRNGGCLLFAEGGGGCFSSVKLEMSIAPPDLEGQIQGAELLSMKGSVILAAVAKERQWIEGEDLMAAV